VFGNGNSKSLWGPKVNDYFQYLKETDKLEVVDFKSANNYTVALMSDGNLYGWGSNESGQMGIKTEIGKLI
jgi:alpha-tubulin suppressor-like RCC1 family protein